MACYCLSSRQLNTCILKSDIENIFRIIHKNMLPTADVMSSLKAVRWTFLPGTSPLSWSFVLRNSLFLSLIFLSDSLYLGDLKCTPSSRPVLSELESSKLSDSVDLTFLSRSLSTFLLSLGGFLVLPCLLDMVSQQMAKACFCAKVLSLSDHFPFEPHI